jgi:hypothetical protein
VGACTLRGKNRGNGSKGRVEMSHLFISLAGQGALQRGGYGASDNSRP